MKFRPQFLIAALVAALAIATVIWGFSETGSPAKNRAMHEDAQRVSELRGISSALTGMQYNRDTTATPPAAPATLAELAKRQGSYLHDEQLRDPVSNAYYGYTVKDPTHVELCADFAYTSDEEKGRGGDYYYGGSDEGFWNHPAGKKCYVVDLTKAAG